MREELDDLQVRDSIPLLQRVARQVFFFLIYLFYFSKRKDKKKKIWNCNIVMTSVFKCHRFSWAHGGLFYWICMSRCSELTSIQNKAHPWHFVHCTFSYNVEKLSINLLDFSMYEQIFLFFFFFPWKIWNIFLFFVACSWMVICFVILSWVP